MNKEEIKQKDKEDKAIKFYTNYIQAQEKELEWMYRQDEEYYRDEIEQKELLIKGFRTILNLIQKQEKIIESYKEILKWSSHKRKNNTMDYVKVNKKNKFGTNGICQDMRAFKRTGKIKYRAYITFQGKHYSLGSHDSLEEAKKARAHAEEEIKCIKENFKKAVDEDVKD